MKKRGNKKTLIAYYSHSGNNEKVAFDLKERIGSEIYQVCERKKRKTISIWFDIKFKRNAKLKNSFIDIIKFDHIIFIAPIWGGKIATPMRAFIEKEIDYLNEFCYVTVCNGESGQKERIKDELFSITNRSPLNVTELSINSLLPEEKRNKVKYTFNYRLSKKDMQQFNDILESFVNIINFINK